MHKEFDCVTYCLQDNHVKTSKYNLITFLPRNLLEQFTRVANTYFLILVLVQLIPDVVPAIPPVSSVSAATTIIPLVFVLGVTAVKDAFDDIVRPCMRHLITQAYDILTHTYIYKECGTILLL